MTLDELIAKVEATVFPSNFGWLVRSDYQGRYFANITPNVPPIGGTFPCWADTALEALEGSFKAYLGDGE